jgi:hypothetical protein
VALFLEDLGQNAAGVGVFDDRHGMNFQDVGSNGSRLIEGAGIAGFEQHKTATAIRFVPTSQKRYALRRLSLPAQESIHGLSLKVPGSTVHTDMNFIASSSRRQSLRKSVRDFRTNQV